MLREPDNAAAWREPGAPRKAQLQVAKQSKASNGYTGALARPEGSDVKLLKRPPPTIAALRWARGHGLRGAAFSRISRTDSARQGRDAEPHSPRRQRSRARLRRRAHRQNCIPVRGAYTDELHAASCDSDDCHTIPQNSPLNDIVGQARARTWRTRANAGRGAVQ